MLSLKTRIIAGLFLVLFYGILTVIFSLTLPSSNFKFHAFNNELMAKQESLEAFPVKSFMIEGKMLAATESLTLEEPDVLPDYKSLNNFFSAHQQLNDALQAGSLKIIDNQGNIFPVELKPRSILELPGLFWLQLLCGLAGMIICLMVWIPAQRDISINSFTLTGLSYVLFSSAAAIYSTRELFISGDLFIWLSGLNHFGALLFSASLSVFIWNYPCKSPSPWLTKAFYASFIVAFVLDQFQLVATPVEGFHLWVMGIFLIGLTGSIWQWLQTKTQPAQRAASLWIVVSIIAGTFFFAGGMILPAILQIAHPASQGLLFTTFLLMYAGMAMGVVRYRLFELDRWWFALWAWLLSGLMIMLFDVLLVSLVSLSGPVTLTLSVALVGWIYFPLRQYLWKKLIVNHRPELDEWLANALPAMLEAQQVKGKLGLKEALQAVFRPLSVHSSPLSDAKPEVTILEQGKTLKVADPFNQVFWLLQHPYEGSKLFTPKDKNIANLVLSLHTLVKNIRAAYVEGAKEERYRISRDMHDDLGAKLLHLLHRSEAGTKPLVREAIKDLRNLLKDMEGESLSLEAAILQWRDEIQRRCEAQGVKLNWQAQSAHIVLGIRQYSELTRIIREATTNALKHAQTTTLLVSVDCTNNQLIIFVENNGLPNNAQVGQIRGLNIMRNRVQKLGGICQYQAVQENWQLSLSVPLSSLTIDSDPPYNSEKSSALA